MTNEEKLFAKFVKHHTPNISEGMCGVKFCDGQECDNCEVEKRCGELSATYVPNVSLDYLKENYPELLL